MERRESWIALDLIEHIGPRTTSKLLEIFADPLAILKAGTRALNDLAFLTSQQRAALSAGADTVALGKVVDQIGRMGAFWVCRDEDDYPALLKEIPDPPSVLYVRGNLQEIEPAVAVVGTRAPSHYGSDVAFTLSRDLSLRGLRIVSGLARGIDTYAHRGALKGVGSTVAVLGSGIDSIYPPENLALAEEICSHGAVITEFSPGTGPRPEHFQPH
jgi:DNA processing protein